MAAKKAGGGFPSRTAEPAASEEPRGPPRLNLAGGKPSWREREAAKAAAGGQAPAASEAPPAEPEAPKRGGYVPPGRRDGASSWAQREERGAAPARTDSPASGSGRYQPPSARSSTPGQGQSPSGSAWRPPHKRSEGERDASADGPRPSAPSSDGKYRPGAFRRG